MDCSARLSPGHSNADRAPERFACERKSGAGIIRPHGGAAGLVIPSFQSYFDKSVRPANAAGATRARCWIGLPDFWEPGC